MRRREAARKRQHAFFAARAHRVRRFREGVARGFRREERVGVLHDALDPRCDPGSWNRERGTGRSRLPVPGSRVRLIDPVLAPFERADLPIILADRRELLLPAMEVIANHESIAASAASAACTSAGVRPLWPTSCNPIGRPSRVRPHGIEIAGCPDRLNGCEQRSISVRTASGSALDRHRRGAERRRRNGERRQHQRVNAIERAIDFIGDQRLAAQRADVVLGEDVARHLEPQPNRRRVVLRPRDRACARDTRRHRRTRDADRSPPCRSACGTDDVDDSCAFLLQ